MPRGSPTTGYVTCPRCKGDCQVFAYTESGNGGEPSQGEYFLCPLCFGTGEADSDNAAAWLGGFVDAEGDDVP